jgi:hypothetical protein
MVSDDPFVGFLEIPSAQAPPLVVFESCYEVVLKRSFRLIGVPLAMLLCHLDFRILTGAIVLRKLKRTLCRRTTLS